MSRQPGGETVYVTGKALLGPSLPTWHLPGRADTGRWFTRCGRLILELSADGDRSRWSMVAIRRLFAGTFGVQCTTCKKAALAQGVRS